MKVNIKEFVKKWLPKYLIKNKLVTEEDIKNDHPGLIEVQDMIVKCFYDMIKSSNQLVEIIGYICGAVIFVAFMNFTKLDRKP